MRQKRVIPGVDEPRGQARGDLYGLKPGEVEAVIERQGGLCLICQRQPRQWVVDHDHALTAERGTSARGRRNEVRGIICAECNTMLGMARDDADTLERAAAYLRAWGAR